MVITKLGNVKKRPALVLSSVDNFNKKSGHTIMAMITSARNAPWPLDVSIIDFQESGLPKASVIRMKLFTLDNRLIVEKIGTLAIDDSQTFKKSFHKLLNNLL